MSGRNPAAAGRLDELDIFDFIKLLTHAAAAKRVGGYHDIEVPLSQLIPHVATHGQKLLEEDNFYRFIELFEISTMSSAAMDQLLPLMEPWAKRLYDDGYGRNFIRFQRAASATDAHQDATMPWLRLFAKKLLGRGDVDDFISLRKDVASPAAIDALTPLVPVCAHLLLKQDHIGVSDFISLREAVAGHEAQEDALTPFVSECGQKILDHRMLSAFRDLKRCVERHENHTACLNNLDHYTFMTLPAKSLGYTWDVHVSFPHDTRPDGSGPQVPRIFCYINEIDRSRSLSALDLVQHWRASAPRSAAHFQDIIGQMARQPGPAQNAAKDLAVVLGLK